jgi:hypothetical protein
MRMGGGSGLRVLRYSAGVLPPRASWGSVVVEAVCEGVDEGLEFVDTLGRS